jgi:adenylyltransferase/sulfurtransferase
MSQTLELEISDEELKALRDNATPHRLIDCREQDEWHICRIEGAQLIPLSNFAEDAPKRLGDKAAHLIVYCHHGVRSMRATQWLRQHGYLATQSLRGGIDLWSEEIDSSVPRY